MFGHAGALRKVGPEQKHRWCQSSEQTLELSRCNPNDFLSRLVTMDYTWLYHPQTKQQSLEWRHNSSPHPKKSRVQNLLEKLSPHSIFWDQDSILLIDYLPKAKLSTRSITHLCRFN
jgi:hypothetical protein